jgi:hypothetical protein
VSLVIEYNGSYGHFSLDGVNCDVCTKREGRVVTLTECSYAQPGDRAEIPSGEVGTVLEVLGTAKRRNGLEVQMLRVETPNGLRIWASDDLASLARDLPSKVNPVEGGVVATTNGGLSDRRPDDAQLIRESELPFEHKGKSR